MRCSILMCGYDRAYFEALARYLMASDKHGFEITLLTIEETMNANGLLSLIQSKDEAVHLCVFDVPTIDLLEQQLSNISDMAIVQLTEAMVAMYEDGNTLLTRHSIFKYQEASKIASALYECFLEHTDYEVMDQQGRTTRVYGCYSPIGGSGNTTIAQVIANIKASRGHKVLHISTEIFPSYHLYYTGSSHHNLSDYLAYMIKNKNWAVGLEQMITIDNVSGIYYFYPHIHMQDMMEMENTQFKDLIEHIKDHGLFDYIVIDYSTSKHNMFMTTHFICDKHFFTVRMDRSGEEKWSFFKDSAVKSGNHKMIDEGVTIGVGTGTHQPSTQEYTMKVYYDNELYRHVGSEGMRLNSASNLYKQMEASLNE